MAVRHELVSDLERTVFTEREWRAAEGRGWTEHSDVVPREVDHHLRANEGSVSQRDLDGAWVTAVPHHVRGRHDETAARRDEPSSSQSMRAWRDDANRGGAQSLGERADCGVRWRALNSAEAAGQTVGGVAIH